jgi:hypothetical protein
MNNNIDTIKLGFYSIKKYVETVKCRLKTSLLEWWWLISEKRCDTIALIRKKMSTMRL